MSENSRLFSERIRKERDKLGLSQREVANRCGIGYNTYQSWEIGRRTPSINNSTLVILSKFFKVSPLYLLGETPYRSTWEEYDSLHEEDSKRIRIEIGFIEYAKFLGCDFTNFDQEDFSLFQTTVNKCILDTYRGIQGRKENNE